MKNDYFTKTQGLRTRLTVSQAARELTRKLHEDVTPKQISDLFYQRKVNDQLCPIVGGRRLIPRYFLAVLGMVLQGKSIEDPDPCITPAGPKAPTSNDKGKGAMRRQSHCVKEGR